MSVWWRDKNGRRLQVGRSGLLCARNRPRFDCLRGLLEDLLLKSPVCPHLPQNCQYYDKRYITLLWRPLGLSLVVLDSLTPRFKPVYTRWLRSMLVAPLAEIERELAGFGLKTVINN